jgi:hypothetical protein
MKTIRLIRRLIVVCALTTGSIAHGQRFDPVQKIEILHGFTDPSHGLAPSALTVSSDGKLIGLTASKGSSRTVAGGVVQSGSGTVFSFDPRTRSFELLHTFHQSMVQDGRAVAGEASDGEIVPSANGVAMLGRRALPLEGWEVSVIVRRSLEGALTRLSFPSGVGIVDSFTTLSAGRNGDLYAVVPEAGDESRYALYRIDASGRVTRIHDRMPRGTRVVEGADRSLYYVDPYGGDGGGGAVLQLTDKGVRTVYEFQGRSGVFSHGRTPSQLVMGPSGILYGITRGRARVAAGEEEKSGTLFSLTPGGEIATLYAFPGEESPPETPPLVHSSGAVYMILPSPSNTPIERGPNRLVKFRTGSAPLMLLSESPSRTAATGAIGKDRSGVTLHMNGLVEGRGGEVYGTAHYCRVESGSTTLSGTHGETREYPEGCLFRVEGEHPGGPALPPATSAPSTSPPTPTPKPSKGNRAPPPSEGSDVPMLARASCVAGRAGTYLKCRAWIVRDGAVDAVKVAIGDSLTVKLRRHRRERWSTRARLRGLPPGRYRATLTLEGKVITKRALTLSDIVVRPKRQRESSSRRP